MLLDFDMRLVMTMFLLSPVLLLVGCDNGSVSKGQAQEREKGQSSSPPSNTKADIALESANGLKAILTYAYAGNKVSGAPFIGTDGREVVLTNYVGRPLLVNIWATWCAPCKAEMPTLDTLAALEEGRVTVIAISQDLEGREPVRAFFKESGIKNLEPFTDPDNRMFDSIGPQITLPTTILYDSQGHEVWRVSGGVEWDDQEIGTLLNEAQ
jgi:thiol-disulfide isomerase/thioredoxin